jgi:hypothetical protein
MRTAGASIITAAEAIQLIRYAEVAGAIVDVQLGREDAARVCEVLAQRQIRFAFYTGRAEKTLLLAEWPDIKVLKTPATAQGDRGGDSVPALIP